jgi:hypothetical protein
LASRALPHRPGRSESRTGASADDRASSEGGGTARGGAAALRPKALAHPACPGTLGPLAVMLLVLAEQLVGGRLAQVMTSEPYASAHRVFWIVDNGMIYRGQRAVDRLQGAWSNLVLVHPPRHASWLNQFEIYFSILQRKALTRCHFANVVHAHLPRCRHRGGGRLRTRPTPALLLSANSGRETAPAPKRSSRPARRSR